MKRVTALLLVIAFAGVILVPVTSTVNNSFSKEIHVADGVGAPVPPLPPCAFGTPNTAVES